MTYATREQTIKPLIGFFAALPWPQHPHKHSAVGRNLAPRLRTLVAMLCIALSFVFASASAASVVDGVQHSSKLAHEHGFHLSFDVVDGDHHAEHPDDQDHGAPDGTMSDHQPGAGHHHHSDAPVGTLACPLEAGRAVVFAGLKLRIDGATSARSVRPGGLERPPKGSTNLS